MTLMELPLRAIKWTRPRRQDQGDIDRLAESIEKVGLLHPVVINTRHEVVCGDRRIAACEKLGHTAILCHVVGTLDDAVAAIIAERDENLQRKPLTPTEMVQLGKRLEEVELIRAEQRMKAGAEPEEEPKGATRDKVGEALGVSGKTYEHAKVVVEAAEESPEEYGDLPEKMDETGSVNAAYEELKARWSAPAGRMKRTDISKFKPGNNQDPDNLYAGILNKLSALSREITILINTPGHVKLREYLHHVGLVYNSAGSVIINGREYKTKFKGFGVRQVIRMAGKRRGEALMPEELRALYLDADAAESQTPEEEEKHDCA